MIFLQANETSPVLLQKLLTGLNIRYCLAIPWWVFPLKKVQVGQLASPPVNKACVVPCSLRLGFGGEDCSLFPVDPPALSLASSSLLKISSS